VSTEGAGLTGDALLQTAIPADDVGEVVHDRETFLSEKRRRVIGGGGAKRKRITRL
jgi:rRNA processing protein Krr1/Pno1